MSKLKTALEEYLTMRRAAGFKLETQGSLLQRFVEFAEKKRASRITRDLALRWATQPKGCDPAQWAKRLAVVQRFASYQSAIDPSTELCPPDLLPHRFRRKPPYVYSDEQIQQIIAEAKNLRSPSGLRAATFSTLFGLLAVTGMRVGEAIALDRADVDISQAILSVRHSKFGKSRLIPIHSSTAKELQHYARLRDRLFKLTATSAFFVSRSGRRLSRSGVKGTFVLLSRRIGLRKPDQRWGPRIHDLRHGFALKTLSLLYKSGADVEQHIPVLSTYLGHANVANTYWYLTATPELLLAASARLDRSPEAMS